MFTCLTLLLFPYPVPADIHGSVQHVTLKGVPVDVLPRLFLWFSQVKHLECHFICPPQEVQCVNMYSVAWDVLVFCANHCGLCLGSCMGGTVWECCVRRSYGWAVHMGLWPSIVQGSCVREAVWRLCG